MLILQKNNTTLYPEKIKVHHNKRTNMAVFKNYSEYRLTCEVGKVLMPGIH